MELKTLRLKQKLTQVEIEKKIGVSLNTYLRWEYGVGNPSSENKKKLDSILNKPQKKEMQPEKIVKQIKPNLFEEFWKAYPKKKSKGQAEKAFISLQKSGALPNIDILVNAINLQKKTRDWMKESGQFIPYPSTWLNSHGWLDETAHIKEPRPQVQAYQEFKGYDTDNCKKS